METKYTDEADFNSLFPSRSKWQSEVQAFLDSDEKFAVIEAKNEADVNRIASGLNGAVAKIAKGQIKVRQSHKDYRVGLIKVD